MSIMSGNRNTLSSFLVMIVLVAIVLFAATMLLGGSLSEASKMQVQAVRQSAAPAIEWLRPGQVDIPRNLAIRKHAAKHNGEAEEIYKLLLEGQCVAAAKFCGGSEIERLYTCVDPVTGIVGAVLQFGNEITTGFYERGNSGYWAGRTEREKWEVCE